MNLKNEVGGNQSYRVQGRPTKLAFHVVLVREAEAPLELDGGIGHFQSGFCR